MKPKTPDQKSVTVGSLSYEKMWAEIASKTMSAPLPEGGKTPAIFAAEHKISVKQAKCRLERGKHLGLLRTELHNVSAANGTTRMTTVYFPA